MSIRSFENSVFVQKKKEKQAFDEHFSSSLYPQ